jgi:hypothetical protein
MGPNDTSRPGPHQKPRDTNTTVWPDVDDPEPRSDESSDKGPLERSAAFEV